ncbi:MAG: hypothetical protein M1833_006217 [Piccolia ochrophora]|nr:MAG: hypothetical protein M1833_006217 [Piccolia ochrophora]
MSSAQRLKIRRIVLTGSVAAVAATGAWYGAGLKARQEFKQEEQQRQEASPAERMASLEHYRSELVARRIGLERKILELERKRGES